MMRFVFLILLLIFCHYSLSNFDQAELYTQEELDIAALSWMLNQRLTIGESNSIPVAQLQRQVRFLHQQRDITEPSLPYEILELITSFLNPTIDSFRRTLLAMPVLNYSMRNRITVERYPRLELARRLEGRMEAIDTLRDNQLISTIVTGYWINPHPVYRDLRISPRRLRPQRGQTSLRTSFRERHIYLRRIGNGQFFPLFLAFNQPYQRDFDEGRLGDLFENAEAQYPHPFPFYMIPFTSQNALQDPYVQAFNNEDFTDVIPDIMDSIDINILNSRSFYEVHGLNEDLQTMLVQYFTNTNLHTIENKHLFYYLGTYLTEFLPLLYDLEP